MSELFFKLTSINHTLTELTQTNGVDTDGVDTLGAGNATTSVPTDTDTDGDTAGSSSSSSTGAIIGGVCGALIAVGLAVGAVVLWRRHEEQSKGSSSGDTHQFSSKERRQVSARSPPMNRRLYNCTVMVSCVFQAGRLLLLVGSSLV